jgi:membrane protein YqaA with SNARE-associated domain
VLNILLLFLLVFLLNVIPAFAPPTWMVFSFLGFRFPEHMGVTFALAGALAATLGRCTLAKGSNLIVRQHFLSEKAKQNVDVIREQLSRRKKLTFSILLFYAFTPLPSNYLFIAYGLTAMELKLITISFFIGRWVSYSFWTFTASSIARRIKLEDTEALSYFSVYFITTQVLLLFLVYLFTKVDWGHLIRNRKFRWISSGRNPSNKVLP